MSGTFALDALIAEARGTTGFDDLGDDSFRVPAEILCRALDVETPLTAAGRAMQRDRVLASLQQRLRLQEWFRRHPEIAEEDIGVPVVVVGLPRTGTTMLYRMLAAADGLVAPAFYEVSGYPPFDWNFDPADDPRLPAAEARVRAMNEAMPELASIYPFEARAPEESIFIYGDSFVSTHEQSHALVPSYDEWFATADKTPAYLYLRRGVQLLQWQHRRQGIHRPGTRWLLKTPDHLHGLEALIDTFPGVHIIHTHRDPIQTIPSICSFIRALHGPSHSRDDSRDIGQAWSSMFARSMGRVPGVRAANPGRFLDIWYRDTVADPRKVAEQVFDFIDRPLTEQGWAEMDRWRDANQRDARPAHHYTLEEFGLSEDGIRRAFRDYREAYIEPVRA